MIRVRIQYLDHRVEVATDAELNPDVLDELTTRALRLFKDSLHDDDEEAGDDA